MCSDFSLSSSAAWVDRNDERPLIARALVVQDRLELPVLSVWSTTSHPARDAPFVVPKVW